MNTVRKFISKTLIIYLGINIQQIAVSCAERGELIFSNFPYDASTVVCWESYEPYQRENIIIKNPPNELLQTGKGPSVCNINMTLESSTRFTINSTDTRFNVKIFANTKTWVQTDIPYINGYFIICRENVECSPYSNSENRSEIKTLSIAENGVIPDFEFVFPVNDLFGTVRIVAVLEFIVHARVKYAFAVFHNATVLPTALASVSRSGLSAGKIGGIIAGIVGFVVIIIGLSIYIIRRKKVDNNYATVEEIPQAISVSPAIATHYAMCVPESPTSGTVVKKKASQAEYIDLD